MSNRILHCLFVFLCSLLSVSTVSAQNTALVGDMNGDGQLSAEDVTLLVNTLLGRTPERTLRLAEGETPWPYDPESDPHKYVDLGLPSGTLWATCNVGASKPEDCGDYFAWGETQPKTSFSWSNYALSEGSSVTLTDYCLIKSYGHVDGISELSREHDAATAQWGGAWCMPTDEQARELLSSRYTKVANYVLNGTAGFLISSLSNDATIFLPAAGFFTDAQNIDKGYAAFCWTKTLNASNSTSARCIYIDASSAYSDAYSRMAGCTVRPVRLRGSK